MKTCWIFNDQGDTKGTGLSKSVAIKAVTSKMTENTSGSFVKPRKLSDFVRGGGGAQAGITLNYSRTIMATTNSPEKEEWR